MGTIVLGIACCINSLEYGADYHCGKSSVTWIKIYYNCGILGLLACDLALGTGAGKYVFILNFFLYKLLSSFASRLSTFLGNSL